MAQIDFLRVSMRLKQSIKKLKNSISWRSKFMRVLMWLLFVLATIALVILVIECFRFGGTMTDRGLAFRFGRIVFLVGLNVLLTTAAAIVLLLVVWVKTAKSLPELKGWHLEMPESEFSAADAGEDFSLDDYLVQEQLVFDELDGFIESSWESQVNGAFSRYRRDSVCNPETVVGRNWNRTRVLEAENPIGGVLLIHGLSDSPYSLREIGLRLHREGYTVVWLRMPGHGTCPCALANVEWPDWTAAVKVGVRGLKQKLPEGKPLIMAGYSNGGALAVNYALAAIAETSLPKIEAILLFSPMIGINPLARLFRIYHTVALVSRTVKALWSNVDAEVDPFKYSSWPTNASIQAWDMTQEVERQLGLLEKQGRLQEIPPILAMQSVVDSTVRVPKLISSLFEKLHNNSSELFLFDIDRFDQIANLFNLSFEEKIFPNLEREDLPFQLTILRNAKSDSRKVILESRVGDQSCEEMLELEWPEGIVSLSHIAIPFSAGDRLYGNRAATADTGINFGSISLRGESSALLLSDALFVRCRYNPFYELMENRMIDWVNDVLEPVGSDTPSVS
ncbi:alpha/beta fold hydrolase [Mariniblastus sp.]|nr:alpha/beta fold hydrolase [Mariniblastus sp.]MDC0294003.1 alpha/beta fold hydrolase [Mariniblastus sp.]